MKLITKNVILIIVAILVISLLSGCLKNRRWYIKDNITFSSDLYIKEDRKYNLLEIGTVEKPYYLSKVDFKLKYNNKIFFDTKTNDIDKLTKLAVKIQNPLQYAPEWPIGSYSLTLKGAGFIINGDKILCVYINSIRESSQYVKISSGRSDTFFELPLTENQVVSIFGKEDRFHEFFMH